MNFAWAEEQLMFRDSVQRFAAETLDGLTDPDEGFSRAAWDACARFGIQGLPVPEAYGGSGADTSTVVLAFEALGRGCRDNGLLFSIGAHLWSCAGPILRFGTDDQKRRYLPGLCDGSLVGVQAMTEPETGSDAFGLRTAATPDGDDFVLAGSKTYITNAPVADVFVVFARTDTKGPFGLTAFLVERDTPGLVVGSTFDKMGLRGSPMSELAFDGCRISADQVLGRRGGGMAIFNHSIFWERGCIIASGVGAMKRELDGAVAYAKERQQFGKPIGSFQSVANRLVDMKLRVETSELMLYRLAWLMERDEASAADAAMVKLWLSESWVQNSLDALQVHGAYGYMRDSGVEREVRDALASRIYSGTSDIQRQLVARGMGL